MLHFKIKHLSKLVYGGHFLCFQRVNVITFYQEVNFSLFTGSGPLGWTHTLSHWLVAPYVPAHIYTLITNDIVRSVIRKLGSNLYMIIFSGWTRTFEFFRADPYCVKLTKNLSKILRIYDSKKNCTVWCNENCVLLEKF